MALPFTDEQLRKLGFLNDQDQYPEIPLRTPEIPLAMPESVNASSAEEANIEAMMGPDQTPQRPINDIFSGPEVAPQEMMTSASKQDEPSEIEKLMEQYRQLGERPEIGREGLANAMKAQNQMQGIAALNSAIQDMLRTTSMGQYRGTGQGVNRFLEQLGQSGVALEKDKLSREQKKRKLESSRLKDLMDAYQKRMNAADKKKAQEELAEYRKRSLDLQEKRDDRAANLDKLRAEALLMKASQAPNNPEAAAEKAAAITAAREAAKEDAKFRAEGRKINRELDQDVKKLEQTKKRLADMKKSFEKYKKDTLITGPVGTLFGATGRIDPEDNKMQAEFNRFALEEMGRMFEGMSKAIDSDAERRFFESTQPNISNFAETNEDIMDRYMREIDSLLNKAKSAQQVYKETLGKPETDIDPAKQRREGFREPAGERIKMRTPDGKIRLVPKELVEKAKAAGAEEI